MKFKKYLHWNNESLHTLLIDISDKCYFFLRCRPFRFMMSNITNVIHS